jgi:hypothetical protein
LPSPILRNARRWCLSAKKIAIIMTEEFKRGLTGASLTKTKS